MTANRSTKDPAESPTRRAGAFGLMRSAAAAVPAPPQAARSAWSQTSSLIRGAAADAQKSRLPQMAAALAYRTIFGLIPMAVVGLVVLKAFVTDAEVKSALHQAMAAAGLDRIEIREPAAPEEAVPWTWLGPSIALPIDDAAFAPDPPPAGEPTPPARAPARLDDLLEDLIGRASGLDVRVIGWIGVATLIYAAISMLIEVERAFNQIYRVPIGRSWVRRIMQYWTLLTLGSIFLVATFWVGEQFRQGVARIAAYSGAGTQSELIVRALGYGITVAISTILLVLAYMAVPNTRVKFTAALTGGAIAALMWESGKWAFTEYLHYSTNYARLYGSLALIPLFLLWVYVTWTIVLFGLYVSYQIQHIRARTVAQPESETAPAVVDPLSILAVAGLLAQRFDQGRSTTPQDAARQLNINTPIAHQMLERLAEAQIANRLSTPDTKPLYALSRPPAKIQADEVLRLGEELAGHVDGAGRATRAGAVIAGLRRARLESVRSRTLADLMAESAEEPAPVEDPAPAAEDDAPVPPSARPATPPTPAVRM